MAHLSKSKGGNPKVRLKDYLIYLDRSPDWLLRVPQGLPTRMATRLIIDKPLLYCPVLDEKLNIAVTNAVNSTYLPDDQIYLDSMVGWPDDAYKVLHVYMRRATYLREIMPIYGKHYLILNYPGLWILMKLIKRRPGREIRRAMVLHRSRITCPQFYYLNQLLIIFGYRHFELPIEELE
ncbi:MAG: hypothetical protein ACPL1K_05310 [Candidatus Kryptoniota bacterium]